MSYIPKPKHQKNGAARIKPTATPLDISFPTLSNRTRSLRNQGTLSESKEVHLSLASETPLPSQNIHIHNLNNSGASIVRLFPLETATQSHTDSEGKRLDDSAIGIQSSSCTYPALGLNRRPATAEKRVSENPIRVSTRLRSASDNNSGTTVHDAVTNVRAPVLQDVQKHMQPPSSSQTKIVCRKTALSQSNVGGSGSQINFSQVIRTDNGFRPWVAKESDFIAQKSMRYWTSGRTVDYNAISRELGRPHKEVRTILHLMLLEYRLFAHKQYWPPNDQAVVAKWAAAEFPKCPTLNSNGKGSRNKQYRHPLAGIASVNTCLSILRCNRRQPMGTFVDTDNTASADMEPDNAPHIVPTTVAVSRKPVFEFVSGSSAFFGQNQTPEEDNANEPRRDSAGTTSRSVDDAIGAITALTFGKQSQSQAAVHVERRASSSSHRSVNVVSRNSRMQRANGRHKRSAKTDNSTESVQAKSNSSGNAAALAAATLSTPRQTVAKKVLEPKRVSFGVTETVIKTETHSSKSSRPSSISGSTKPSAEPEAQAPVSGGSKDTELSPEQSTDTCDFNRLDGDIDMRFFDVPAVARKFIRNFVDKYIDTFFDSFFCRIAHPRVDDDDRLCQKLEGCLDGDIGGLSDNNLLVRLQKEVLAFDALDIAELCGSGDIKGSSGNMEKLRSRFARASLHFHMCFSRAIEECRIYRSDDNWPSANAYATSVFNRTIEDAHYLVFEGLRGTSEYSSGSGLSSIQYLRTDEMVARANRFKRAYYMGIVASALVSRYVQSDGQQTFLKRIEVSGMHPVPTALEFDDNLSEEELDSELETPWSDVSIRGELHNLIMEVMPNATNKSTMLAMQRAIETYNTMIVDHYGRLYGDLSAEFDNSTAMVDVEAKNRMVSELTRGAMTVDVVCKVAECLADLWFDQLKMEVLQALMVDHTIWPVSLSDIRRWIFEDRSPGGRNIDFALNLRLYSYLKYSRVRMNEVKWLYASGAATRRLIELAVLHLQRKELLEHVNVGTYTDMFSSRIRAIAAGQTVNGKHALLLSESDNKPSISKKVIPSTEAAATAHNETDADPERDLTEARERLERLLVQSAMSSSITHPPHATASHLLWNGTPLQTALAEGSRRGTSAKTGIVCQTPSVADLEPGTDARISGLEAEIAKLRREMCDIAEVRREVSSMLGMVYSRYPGGVATAPPFQKQRTLSEL
ncbi:hypothetical protein EV175_003106 [Coemansia sp. RSA 1933]|nr:hypothetical protein EV175_003106 [Coemansia sp. RSA 1933]